jgi:hypothetical protein
VTYFLGEYKTYQSMWDHEILYAGRSGKDEQLSKEITCVKNRKHEHCGRLKFKITFCFVEATHEPLHSGK